MKPRFIVLAASLALVALYFVVEQRAQPAAAQPLSDPAPGGKIDGKAWADTANGQAGDFLVVLEAQANVRAVTSSTPDREAQAARLVNSLQDTAAASQPAVQAQLDTLGVRYRSYWIVNLLAVHAGREVIAAMAARDDVASIESNRAFRVPLEQPVEPPFEEGLPNRTTIEPNIQKVNAPGVWQKGDTGKGRVYANADTGVQWDHPALKNEYRGWNGVSADHNYNWWDAVHSDFGGGGNTCGFNLRAPCDDYGHGTHTMGTGIGTSTTDRIGMAYGAKWVACRNMEGGVGMPSTYIECMQFFMAPTDLNGANPDASKRPDAVGNSYGCPTSEGCTAHSLQTAVQNMRASGIFMSVSAGNSGSACSSTTDPPAVEDAVITIGATDNNDVIASFSSRGPVTVDGSNLRKPDLVAPGVNVKSSYPHNTYAILSGTSMSSPHVAGAVVLLWAAFPTLVRNVDQTESILEQSAKALTTSQKCGGDGTTQVPNNVYGYGRVDVLAAYNWPK